MVVLMLTLSETEYAALTHRTAPVNNRSAVARNSMAVGKSFEELIIYQCREYQKHDIAMIDKTPEPFLVLKRTKDGLFSGRFTGSKAQPDFQGTIKGGRSVILEAKYTSKDRMRQDVLTDTQAELLEIHQRLGALCLVVCSISGKNFSVPYNVWSNMKGLYGRKYVTVEDLQKYECGGKFIDFLGRSKT